MGYHYAVLGTGMQGCAAAYDLARHGEADRLLLIDRDESVARSAAQRVERLLGRAICVSKGLEVDDLAALGQALQGVDGVFSALPYGLNPKAALAAVQAGASFCDLGGNTDVVRATLALDTAAKERGVSVVPDCGLAPGLSNVLAACLIARDPLVQHVRIRCGGLPQNPKPPLDYKLVFHIGGLTNEYTGEAECLRDGALVRVPTLHDVEELHFGPPLGRCEAFTTSGGTSTCCETWRGRLKTYDYKTVRYPGHAAKMRLLMDLGLLDQEPVRVGDQLVVPRDLFHAVAAPKLRFPGDRDLVILRVMAEGVSGSRGFELLDLFDELTGFSAMERTTAFPAAATLHLQVSGRVTRGAAPPERAVPPEELLRAVRQRGLEIRDRSAE